jgi:eukaryotic-like serine/threonine-protein kinase
MIGRKINNYEIKRLLGEGGMGAVYLAEHPLLGRKAAIKVLKPELAASTELVQRFLNEARAANAIHHPNIIDIIDVGLLPEAVPYMMMEFLEGESLAARLRSVQRLPVSEACKYARQTASALAAAHAVSIVHRDLKPDNLFIVPDAQNPGQERIKVLDFGIAKLRPEFAPGTPRTGVGALMGTPAYMSPEQCMGKTTEIDHRADVYALGIILHEMLCGQPPFVGQNFGELFLQHITVAPKPLRSFRPDVPVQLEAVVLKALEKDSKDRIQTMEEFLRLLPEDQVRPTLVLEEQPKVAGRDGGSSLVSATSGRSALWSSASDPAFTTLSSTIGQVGTVGQDAPAGRGGRRIVLVGAAVLALAALGFGVGLRLLGRPAAPSPSGQRPEKSAAAAAQPISPLIAPLAVPVPPPAEPRVPAQPKLPEPVDNWAVVGHDNREPAAKNTSSSKRERAKRKSSGRSERRNPESVDPHRPAPVAPPVAPEPVQAAPRPSPPPAPAASPAAPKVIRHEKF